MAIRSLTKSKMISCFDTIDLLGCGIAAILLFYFSNPWQKMIVAIVCLWFRRRQLGTIILLSLLFILSCFYTQQSIAVPSTTMLEIDSIAPAYVIAKADDQKVIVYGLDDVSYDDVVFVEGDWEQIHSTHNFFQFSFDEYLARRDIYFSINAENSYILKQGSSLRSHLYRYLQSLPQQEGAIARSMLFGIPTEDNNYFIQACGLHLATLAYTLHRWMKKRFSTSFADKGICLFLFAMGCVWGFFDSLFRVFCFRLPCLIFKKEGNRIGASILLILLLRHYLLNEITFLLPFCFRLMYYFANKKGRNKLLGFSILIFFQLCYFHEIYWLQTIFFSCFRKLYCVLYIFVVIAVCFPPFFSLLFVLFSGIDILFSWTKTWVYHYVPSILWIICWLIFLWFWLHRYTWKLLLCIFFLLGYSTIEPYLDPFFEVHIFDVGQGDCTLITLPHHQGTIMIDIAGSMYKNIPQDIIQPILQDLQIHSIDLLIITHEDFDHSGGLEELKKIVKVNKIQTIKEDIAQPMKIYTLLKDHEGKDENADSIITWFGQDDLFYLFMGDAGIVEEMKLLELYDQLPVHFLKLGHHGSDTSSSLEFLHDMKPQYALISVGKNNRYGHPSPDVLKRLKDEEIPYFSTAENGGICIRSTKLLKYITTATGDFVIIKDR